MKSRESRIAFLFLLPSFVGYAVFYLLPFGGGVLYSMLDKPLGGKFAGLDNYAVLLTNPVFLRAASNTLVFSALCLPLIILISLGIAMLLKSAVKGFTFFRAATVLPLAVPVASIVLVWQSLFDEHGPLNSVLGLLGISGLDWMNGPGARWVVLAVYLWKNVGYDMILFLTGLQGIPNSFYEAAKLEGAGRWRIFTRITLIYLSPTMFFVLVISIINSFKVFRETYLMAGPYPDQSIYFLQHYMNNAFFSLNYQKLTSAAIVMSIGVYFIVLFLFGIERRFRRVFD